MKRIFVLLLASTLLAPLARGQNSPSHELVDALNLLKLAKFLPAIGELQALTSENGLSRIELGRAYTLLGYCYKEQGNFEAAQKAYEQALAVLQNDPASRLDYANAMNNLADLYRDSAHLEQAKETWQKAAEIYTSLENHSGVGGIDTNLAGVAIEQHHRGDAKRLVAKAQEEFKLAKGMTDDEQAGVSITEAWLADAGGQRNEALDDYDRALHYWQRAHGSAHPVTGWGYVLLGRAEANVGRFDDARQRVQQGMAIIANSEGVSHPRYLAAQLVYSQVLDLAGSHAEAVLLRASAQRSLADVLGKQCTSCTVSVAALLAR